MYVINRKGNKEPVHFDTISDRISKLLGDNDKIDPVLITQKIVSRMYSGIKTTELDDLASQICMSSVTDEPSYGTLASKLIISDNHKNTSSDFLSVLQILYNNMDILGEHSPLISTEALQIAEKHKKIIDETIDYNRDYLLDFFAFKTLEKAYLLKVNKIVVERPQHLFMRVSIGIHGDDIDNIVKTYDLLSQKYFTHATPTLFHAGTLHAQMSSCFLESIEDSVEGIFETLGDSAQISKWAGGIGLSISNIRSSGAYIRKTGGKSDGVLPLLRTLNSVACYINQCFTPETIVYTIEGPTKISEIVPYDLVITDGGYKPVLGVKKSSVSKQILVINSTRVTDEHQVYAITSSRGLNNINTNLAKYVPAKDLKIGDVLCFPIPQSSDIHIESDIVKFYALVLRNGDVIPNNSTHISTVSLKLFSEDELEFVKTLLSGRNIEYKRYENVIQFNISQEHMKNLFKFNFDDLYGKDKTKVFSRVFMTLSIENTKTIINTMFNNKNVVKNDSIDFLECLRFCLLKIGILSEISGYQIKIMDSTEYIRVQKCLYTLVRNIETQHYEGDVYDLNVEDNHNYTTQLGLVHNSGKRNGSFAIYIEPWHPDIFTFLDAKKNHGAEETRARDLFYALWVPDLFMKRVEKNEKWTLFCPDTCPLLYDTYGEEFEKLYTEYESDSRRVKKVINARDVWSAIISTQIEAGVPYILYKDACNMKSNQKNLGTIRSSNLCVSGDTMILTSKGYYPISDIVDKNISVWNGEEWSETTPMKTGVNQKLINVMLSNGMDIKCTPYHKFYIETGTIPSEKSCPQIIEAKDLKIDMKIVRFNLGEVEDNNIELDDAYTNGIFSADGNIKDKDCKFNSLPDKAYCKRHIEYQIDDTVTEKCKGIEKQILTLNVNLKDKFFVPINYSINSKLRWLEGFVDGDGCVINNNEIKNIQITSIHKEFLKNVSYLLQTFGIISSISKTKNKRIERFSNEKGEVKEYQCKELFRLNIDSESICKLYSIGFNPKRLDISNCRLPHHKTNRFITITGIVDDNEYADTFCFTEPKKNKGIFNGILIGNCAEIIQYSSKNEIATCNLASICLPKFVEDKIGENYMKTWDAKLLNIDGGIDNYTKNDLIVYTKEDCIYCKLLKKLFKNMNISYTEIGKEEAEKIQLLVCNKNDIVCKYQIVPQVYRKTGESEYNFMGGYDDAWKFLKPKIDYEKLADTAGVLVENLNKIIDRNYYPVEKCKTSNMRHRPIGIGIQGLADVFIKLRAPFESDEAGDVNKKIFEAIYYGAMKKSMELAIRDKEYDTFRGSPLSEGKFQFNLWGIKDDELSGMWDWESLRKDVMLNGVRNSLLTAVMPTASTSQIMGNNECIEPYTSNVYTRRTLAGEFTVVNNYLLEDLMTLDLLTTETKDRLMYDRGSVQKIKGFPKFLKDVYKTVWEIKQKRCIEMSAERAPFICQSQSLNVWLESPNFNTLTSAHFLGWKLGLKTGSYYIRSKPAIAPQRFGFSIDKEKKMKDEDDKECLMCSA